MSVSLRVSPARERPDAARERPYPLSPMQAGMLYQSLLAEGSGYDHEQLRFSLREAVDIELLRAAWLLVLQNDAALSACFEAGDPPKQRFELSSVVPVHGVDLKAYSASEREAQIEAFLRADRKRGFDLGRAPLLRMTVFATDSGSSEAVLSFHHVLMDGASLVLVLSDLFSAYDALRGGRAPVLPARRSYTEFLDWVNGLDHAGSRAYFREQLGSVSATTALPGAEPAARPLARAGYAEFVRYVEPELRAELLAAAERTEVTVATWVNAAWALLLARHAGETEVVFGVTRSGRHSALGKGAQDSVGLFINTLPMRARLEEGLTVRSFARQLRAQSLSLREHEQTPLFEIDAGASGLRGARCFESLVSFQNWDLSTELDRRFPSRAPFRCALHEQPSLPLNLKVYGAQRVELRLLFDRSRFRDEVVERLLDELVLVLTQFACDPARSLSEITLLSAAEQQLILRDWNATQRTFPDQLLIQQPFEQRAAERPHATALEFGGATMSYGELDARANRLAHVLQTRGAAPGVFVGVCLTRGFELVIALLAVLKSGAAYVPVDPSYPAQRIESMLESVAWVVTEPRHARLCQATPALYVSTTSGEGELLERAERDVDAIRAALASRPSSGTRSHEPCYTIFTSGSTGVPNGVVLTHRAVMNTLDWVTRSFDVGPHDRALFVTSPCFDLSVWDVFGTLGAGATLVIASETLLADPGSLASALGSERITIWNSAPAALSQLVPHLASVAGHTLRLTLLSGDWIPISLPDQLRAVFPAARVISLGGATEAAIWSNWFEVERIDPRWVSIPYGKPIQNCRYHVLDAEKRPVPIGVSGDLYIGGACLAEGYLNRPELTRQRFIPDPFQDDPRERLYKTGDLARYFDDGNLEFLGRSDTQLKVRGFRVELGEVEACLSRLPGVTEAVCSGVRDATGNMALAAYLVGTPEAAPDPTSVRRELGAALPSYMIPSEIVILPALPRSSNGKIDRKALPLPNQRRMDSLCVAPETEPERELLALWEELLGKRPIGVEDDFFALGGHSLLAILMVSRAKAQLGLTLSLERLLQAPTIRALLRTSSEATPRHVLPFNRHGARPPLVLLPGVYGTLFMYRELPRLFGPEQPIYLLRATERDAAVAGELDIERMAEIYEAELNDVYPRGPVVVGGYSFGALTAFELAHRMRQAGRDVPLVISLDGLAPGHPRFLPWPRRLRAHLEELCGGAEQRRRYLADRFANLQRRGLRALGREHELASEVLTATPDMRERIKFYFELNSRARTRYRPNFVEDCELLLLRAAIPERWVGIEPLEPEYGWRKYVSGPISVTTLPGDHGSLLQESNQRRIVAAIAERIETLVAQARIRA